MTKYFDDNHGINTFPHKSPGQEEENLNAIVYANPAYKISKLYKITEEHDKYKKQMALCKAYIQ